MSNVGARTVVVLLEPTQRAAHVDRHSKECGISRCARLSARPIVLRISVAWAKGEARGGDSGLQAGSAARQDKSAMDFQK